MPGKRAAQNAQAMLRDIGARQFRQAHPLLKIADMPAMALRLAMRSADLRRDTQQKLFDDLPG